MVILDSPQQPKLKKELGLLGSFSMGFADVGADIFLALGLIAAYAHGLMPLAILAASIVYISSGFAYAELSAAMPVSGGSAAFGRRAFGPWAGFIAGWGLLLDYTIDIALFAVASAGYLSFFIPQIAPFSSAVASLLILILLIINLLGIKESSRLNSGLTVVVISILILLIILGFGFSFQAEKFLSGLTPVSQDPGWNDFLYSITLAMVAFVGIESISQGAEETRNPEKVIPKATLLAVFFVVVFAVLLSTMALGIVSPQTLSASMDNPLVPVAKALPFASLLVPVIAFSGFLICSVSANTGIIGVSRVAYYLSSSGLISRGIKWLHPTFRTPWATIIVFSAIAMALAYFGNMVFLGELYAFGALTAYSVTNLSAVALRFKEPGLARPFRMPFNITIKNSQVSLISIIGIVSCFAVFALVALLHTEGRNFAALWFGSGLLFFWFYSHYRGYIMEPINTRHSD